jgi:hypothetical protein
MFIFYQYTLNKLSILQLGWKVDMGGMTNCYKKKRHTACIHKPKRKTIQGGPHIYIFVVDVWRNSFTFDCKSEGKS